MFRGTIMPIIIISSPQTRHTTLSSTPYRQPENQAPNTTGSNHFYKTFELLMKGIILPETCWASNKICNKNSSVASSWHFISTYYRRCTVKTTSNLKISVSNFQVSILQFITTGFPTFCWPRNSDIQGLAVPYVEDVPIFRLVYQLPCSGCIRSESGKREKAFHERLLKHCKPFPHHPQSHLSNEELTELLLYYYYYYYLLAIRMNNSIS